MVIKRKHHGAVANIPQQEYGVRGNILIRVHGLSRNIMYSRNGGGISDCIIHERCSDIWRH